MDSAYALATGVLIFCAYKLYKRYDPAVRASFYLSLIYRYLLKTLLKQLDAIPTVGWSTPGLSYLSAIRFIFQGKAILDEGYDKVRYHGFLYTPTLASMCTGIFSVQGFSLQDPNDRPLVSCGQ